MILDHVTDPDRLEAYQRLGAQSPTLVPRVTAPINPATAHRVKMRYASAFFTWRLHEIVKRLDA